MITKNGPYSIHSKSIAGGLIKLYETKVEVDNEDLHIRIIPCNMRGELEIRTGRAFSAHTDTETLKTAIESVKKFQKSRKYNQNVEKYDEESNVLVKFNSWTRLRLNKASLKDLCGLVDYTFGW